LIIKYIKPINQDEEMNEGMIITVIDLESWNKKGNEE